jgi:hypothetical protein
MELGWATFQVTQNWASGYESATSWFYYDYGDAECPTGAGSCNNGWTQNNVWQVAYGNRSALALPEIYRDDGTNGAQWQYISKSQGWIGFSGSVTQYQACAVNPSSCYAGTSSATDTVQSQGWAVFWSLLNADPATATSLTWSTDFTWDN